MQTVVLIIHLVICVSLIGLVLLQRSEGGALGIGGGSGALMSGRGAADTLARMTSFAGGFFLVTSLALTVMTSAGHQASSRSLLDLFPQQQHQAPAPARPAAPTPQQPSVPDPTQSSAPQAVATTQLASIETPTPTTTIVAPPPTVAAAHAAPVLAPPAATSRPASATIAGPLPASGAPSATHTAAPVPHAPAPSATASNSTSTHTPGLNTPAHTQPAAVVTQPATTPQNPGAPVRTVRQTTAPVLTPITGVPTLNQTAAESAQGSTGLTAVHRDHTSGPDQ